NLAPCVPLVAYLMTPTWPTITCARASLRRKIPLRSIPLTGEKRKRGTNFARLAGDAMDTTANEPATILLVDDRPASLLALQAIFASTPYRLLTASSGDAALKIALHE